MTLTTTIETNGTTIEVDLDELDRYGHYYIDKNRDFIVRAIVYTHGTKDSRWVGTTEIGTDYTLTDVPVDQDEIKRFIDDELNLRLTDEEAEHIATYYQMWGTEVIGHWIGDLGEYRILAKADERIISTDVQEPVVGWDQEFEEIITRATNTTNLTESEIQLKLLGAARSASPGDYEYRAKVELTGTPF